MTAAEDSDDNSSSKREGETEEDAKIRKRKERLEQNRISARESRKRKKTMIEELQRTVITLSRENKDLNERNESLRRQLMEIGAKYPNIVPLQAIVGQATQSTAPQQNAAAQEAVAAASTAATAASTADVAAANSVMASFNPMAWLTASAQQQQQAAAPSQANV